MRDAVEVEGVSVAFDRRAALVDVSFRVPAGTFTGMLGPNGAGKTTLLRAMLGLVEYSGRIVLHGRTGYVPQLGAVATEFPVDALGVVLMGRYPRLGWFRRAGREDRRAALALLEEVGLAERSRTPFGDLSGGQRQRVLVARALAQDGDVLLLDEPLTGVDATSQEAILGVIADRCAAGRTVCMTTHDLGQAARVCDRLLLLDREVVAEGTVEEVFRPDVLRRAYGDDLVFADGGRALLAEDHHHHHDHG